MTETQKSLMERQVEALERIALAVENLNSRVHFLGKLANPFLKEATSLSGWEGPTPESWQIGDHEFDEWRKEE